LGGGEVIFCVANIRQFAKNILEKKEYSIINTLFKMKKQP
jgi:hypothetical protein